MCGRQAIEHLQELLLKVMQNIIQTTAQLGQDLQQLFAQHIRQHQNMQNLLSTALKIPVRTSIKNILNECDYIDGAGFASHMMQQDYWILEWWFKQDRSKEHVHLELDQATQQRIDFRTFEWFIQAVELKKTYIHGPYVDYLCSSQTAYTITTAHPIFANDIFLGVAVSDFSVGTLEQHLLPTLNKIKHSVVIVNSDQRVVLSNVPKLRTGSLVKNSIKLKFGSDKHPFQILVL